MGEVAALGERELKQAFRQGEQGRRPLSRGPRTRVSQYVRGRAESLSGKRWEVSAVVSIDTSRLSRDDAIAVMAAASQIERRHRPVRRTLSRMRRARQAIQADLLRGIAD